MNASGVAKDYPEDVRERSDSGNRSLLLADNLLLPPLPVAALSKEEISRWQQKTR